MTERRKIGDVEIERTVFDGGEAIYLKVEGEWLCDLPLAVCRIVWDATAARELLSVVHRDSRQHTKRHGFVQSCRDAEVVLYKLWAVVDAAHTYWQHTQHSTDAMVARDTLAESLLPFFPEPNDASELNAKLTEPWK